MAMASVATRLRPSVMPLATWRRRVGARPVLAAAHLVAAPEVQDIRIDPLSSVWDDPHVVPLPVHVPRNVFVCFYADVYDIPLPPGHRFPMEKYAQVRRALSSDPSLQDHLYLQVAPLAKRQDLVRVHCADYVDRVANYELSHAELRRIGFSEAPGDMHLRRTLASIGGTLAATRMCLDPGGPRSRIAGCLAGGTHHAFRAHGEGFSVFNDLACAAAVAIEEFGVGRVVVVDLDVHQGNGTAALFAGDPRVTTFSVHGQGNYPFEKEVSDVDVGLPDGAGDAEMLAAVEEWLPKLLDDPAHGERPGLLLFQAGVDALEGDRMGRLNVTRDGLRRRNHAVYLAALQRGIPCVVAMGGGYGSDPQATVEAHADVYRNAAQRVQSWQDAEVRRA